MDESLLKRYVRKTGMNVKLNFKLSTESPCSYVNATDEEIAAFNELGNREKRMFHSIAEHAAKIGLNRTALLHKLQAATDVGSEERRFLNGVIRKNELFRSLIEKFHDAGRNLR